jgi:hypothetical protein
LVAVKREIAAIFPRGFCVVFALGLGVSAVDRIVCNVVAF